MIIGAFLRWTKTARAGDRAKAAGALAAAYVEGRLHRDDRRAAETAMTYLLDDPAPIVRLAIARRLASCADAPRNVILGLSRDQIEVAGHVVALSDALNDGDLVDIVAETSPAMRRIVAMRRSVSAPVSAALAEIGEVDAVCDLLDNEAARIASVSIRRIAERFGCASQVRARLLDRGDLPSDVRHRLVIDVSEALAGFGLVQQTVGDSRMRSIARDACQRATLHIANAVEIAEMPALVNHLRLRGELTPAFLMHTLCQGNVDFFAAAVVALGDHDMARVRGILVDGREAVIHALFRRIGLNACMSELFVYAVLQWRALSRRATEWGAPTVAERLVSRFADLARSVPEIADLLALVEKLNVQHQRDVARAEALGMTRQAA
jgi:uncharacterized protein (DUF2336 family)